MVDFAELLLRGFELLTRNEPLRQHHQSRFRHILVDSSRIRTCCSTSGWKLLAGHGAEGGARRAAEPPQGAASFEPDAAEPWCPAPGAGNGGGAFIFAVGDDDQSIYAFRGAEVGNMRDFDAVRVEA